MRDLLDYGGLHYSEPLCFGLGSGLDFIYLRDPRGAAPSHVFFGRTPDLEGDLCRHLALDVDTGADDDPTRAWLIAKAWIDRGVPVLIRAELSRLPYYHARTPFPGHRLVLAGYDDARQVALLADTQFPGLQEVTYDELRSARSAQIPSLPLHNEWMVVKTTAQPRPLAEALVLALHENALGMNFDRAPHRGIMGMETLAEDFENWGAFPDWEFCARFAYQIIEVRGTGGSFFRKLYAQFLREAEAVLHMPAVATLAEAMDEIAVQWSALGAILQRAAAERDRSLFRDASRTVRRLATMEETFWGKAGEMTDCRLQI